MRIPVLKTYKLFINGAFPRSESGRSFTFSDSDGAHIANLCRASRKDLRDAVKVARKAQPNWATRTAYNRGQIIYRMAEMIDGRTEQFINELKQCGYNVKDAKAEVLLSIDRLIHYAGWSDKYQQLFSSVNPVAGSYFNFSVPEPTGVVALFAPINQPLSGLISTLIPIIIGGNSTVVLASEKHPGIAITLAEVLNTSDLPAGVVNILTGYEDELLPHIAEHMDINAIWYARTNETTIEFIKEKSASNLKRTQFTQFKNWTNEEAQNPYLIINYQEIKTTWHPIGF